VLKAGSALGGDEAGELLRRLFVPRPRRPPRHAWSLLSDKADIKEEFPTGDETRKTCELTDDGRTLVDDGKIRACIGDRPFTDHDRETNVKTWLGTCPWRCDTGEGVTKK
jgi:hypothetical protein